MRFHQILSERISSYAHLVYKVTRSFPKEEIYGITSQFRRAAISVALNYTEGYARVSPKVHRNFLEISYGSLKETRFLINFTFEENLITKQNYDALIALSDEIGAMLWSILKNMSA